MTEGINKPSKKSIWHLEIAHLKYLHNIIKNISSQSQKIKNSNNLTFEVEHFPVKYWLIIIVVMKIIFLNSAK